MPYTVNDLTTSLEIIGEFPEIKKHYGGHGTQLNVTFQIFPSAGNFLTLDTQNGFYFGKDSDLYVQADMYCSNPLQNRSIEHCLTFNVKMGFAMNVTVDDFDLYLSINDANVGETTITKDTVGMKNRDYQLVLQHVINLAIANFNFVNTEPYSLKKLNTWIPLIREIVSLTASPYI